MREIKFRLIKDNKIVGYEWHRLGCNNHIELFHNEDGKNWININIEKWAYIQHDTKDQYTGLKDKNDKEIYEGDILEITIENKKRKAMVFYSDFRCSFSVEFGAYTNNDLFRYVQYGNQCEVIGNIYENPELLKDN